MELNPDLIKLVEKAKTDPNSPEMKQLQELAVKEWLDTFERVQRNLDPQFKEEQLKKIIEAERTDIMYNLAVDALKKQIRKINDDYLKNSGQSERERYKTYALDLCRLSKNERFIAKIEQMLGDE